MSTLLNFFARFDTTQLIIFGAFCFVSLVLFFVIISMIKKLKSLPVSKKVNETNESSSKEDSSNPNFVNNYYINNMVINNDGKSAEEDSKKDVVEQETTSIEEIVPLKVETSDDDDDEDEEEEEVLPNEETKQIEEGLIDFKEEEQTETKLTTPRRLNLKLRLCNASDSTKNKFSTLKNYLGSYRIKNHMLKHRDLYFIIKENMEQNENGEIKTTSSNYKVAMLTIRRKQLILSLNVGKRINDSIFEDNMEIKEKRYVDFDFNMKVMTEKELQRAISLIDEVMSIYKISKKKSHKEVDYASLYSIELSTFIRRGFGYLLRPSIRLEEANQYNDSLVIKAIILNKIEEKASKKQIPYSISLSELNDKIESGTTIDLSLLKELGFAPKNSNRLIITDGEYLNKRFIIKADGYSTNAVKMIFMTGGEALINRRSAN